MAMEKRSPFSVITARKFAAMWPLFFYTNPLNSREPCKNYCTYRETTERAGEREGEWRWWARVLLSQSLFCVASEICGQISASSPLSSAQIRTKQRCTWALAM